MYVPVDSFASSAVQTRYNSGVVGGLAPPGQGRQPSSATAPLNGAWATQTIPSTPASSSFAIPAHDDQGSATYQMAYVAPYSRHCLPQNSPGSFVNPASIPAAGGSLHRGGSFTIGEDTQSRKSDHSQAFLGEPRRQCDTPASDVMRMRSQHGAAANDPDRRIAQQLTGERVDEHRVREISEAMKGLGEHAAGLVGVAAGVYAAVTDRLESGKGLLVAQGRKTTAYHTLNGVVESGLDQLRPVARQAVEEDGGVGLGTASVSGADRGVEGKRQDRGRGPPPGFFYDDAPATPDDDNGHGHFAAAAGVAATVGGVLSGLSTVAESVRRALSPDTRPSNKIPVAQDPIPEASEDIFCQQEADSVTNAPPRRAFAVPPAVQRMSSYESCRSEQIRRIPHNAEGSFVLDVDTAKHIQKQCQQCGSTYWSRTGSTNTCPQCRQSAVRVHPHPQHVTGCDAVDARPCVERESTTMSYERASVAPSDCGSVYAQSRGSYEPPVRASSPGGRSMKMTHGRAPSFDNRIASRSRNGYADTQNMHETGSQMTVESATCNRYGYEGSQQGMRQAPQRSLEPPNRWGQQGNTRAGIDGDRPPRAYHRQGSFEYTANEQGAPRGQSGWMRPRTWDQSPVASHRGRCPESLAGTPSRGNADVVSTPYGPIPRSLDLGRPRQADPVRDTPYGPAPDSGHSQLSRPNTSGATSDAHLYSRPASNHQLCGEVASHRDWASQNLQGQAQWRCGSRQGSASDITVTPNFSQAWSAQPDSSYGSRTASSNDMFPIPPSESRWQRSRLHDHTMELPPPPPPIYF